MKTGTLIVILIGIIALFALRFLSGWSTISVYPILVIREISLGTDVSCTVGEKKWTL